jgi:hypothetical protein
VLLVGLVSLVIFKKRNKIMAKVQYFVADKHKIGIA